LRKEVSEYMVLKTKEEARANFEAAIAYIPSRYEAGVRKADWLGPAKSDAAEKNFADGISKAVAEKRRQKAIAAMSNEEWREAAATKGAPIIGERIRKALGDWAANWGPMYDQVASKVAALPPKTLDWRANINTRLVPVVETWRRAAGKT
jgi:hypothetical protein